MFGHGPAVLNEGNPESIPHRVRGLPECAAVYAVDKVVNAVTRTVPKSRWVFPDGWGDERAVEHLDITQAGPVERIQIEWHGDEGHFESPMPDLPNRLRTARVLRVRAEKHNDRICVLLPAWDDETPRMRIRFAEELARRGIDSIILEAAYYGMRRHYLVGPTIRTFADMARLSRSIVEEGRSLIHHFMHLGYETGIAGYSMGGSLAATAATLTDGLFAVAPLAASHSPKPPVLDGVMRPRVSWEALMPGDEALLEERLLLPSLVRVAPSEATRKAVIVAGKYDKFVPMEATETIHDHWPGSELRVLDSGHATLVVRRHRQLIDAINDSFTRTFGQ